MSGKIRRNIASIVTRHFPGMILHIADKKAKSFLGLDVSKHCIDVLDKDRGRMIRLGRGNAVYALDMLNYFDYYFDSVQSIAITVNGRLYEAVDFSTPRYQHVLGFDDFPVMCPSLTEPFITTQQYLDFARLGAGDVVLDLGSYSSLTSIAFSKAVGPTGKVIALEPDPSNHAASTINIDNHLRINKLSNIELMQAAVHTGRGTLRFSAEGAMGSAETSAVGSYRGKVIEVEALGLIDIANQHRLEHLDFIKMDIEGAEEKVLSSSSDLFKRFKPRLIIEPHIVDRRLSDIAVVKILKEFGYRCDLLEQYGVKLPLVTAVPL
jgi:FkbM family methyltransferase